ncbi:hypothetical protein BV22DRAFT_1064625 [Leucogyrophana mollusca]|uniref:Uncharacterized protein n=1 Tax=Leucogyrophana mollusca TaxID=85980 RepID=A0ACB8BK16_9AGAM|nr:hypothetical protein BV22DRAFT_1064625 [Leucogyrophana mollusca]
MSDSSTDVSVERKPRTLVLCFDGTAGQYDADNTNVVKFFSLLKKDTDSQLGYYQAGVGTYFAPGVVSPVFSWLAKILDEAFAWYLDEHVMDGYKYLMDNYRPGDKICLFGFSRGAYTARALAGMLNKVGLLPRDNAQQVIFAYKAYKRTSAQGISLAEGFKGTFSQDVKVEFVGVWETVQSTGVLMSRSLPFTDSNTSIKTFRHALALDEHRAKFRPNLYHRPMTAAPNPEVAGSPKKPGFFAKLGLTKRGRKNKSKSKPKDRDSGKKETHHHSRVEIVVQQPKRTIVVVEETDTTGPSAPSCPEPSPDTDVLEVWFAGCHSDVGGGNVTNSVEVSLAQITLRWMVDQVIESQCGIQFDDDALERNGIPRTTFPVPDGRPLKAAGHQTRLKFHNGGLALATPAVHSSTTQPSSNPPPATAPAPQPAPEPNPATSCALAPLYDALQTDKLWWLLEIIPLPFAWQDDNGTWHKKWSIHLGKGRIVPYTKPQFHHTVKERMDYKPLAYKPKAIYNYGHEVFV